MRIEFDWEKKTVSLNGDGTIDEILRLNDYIYKTGANKFTVKIGECSPKYKSSATGMSKDYVFYEQN
jgi:hypothetical protein